MSCDLYRHLTGGHTCVDMSFQPSDCSRPAANCTSSATWRQGGVGATCLVGSTNSLEQFSEPRCLRTQCLMRRQPPLIQSGMMPDPAKQCLRTQLVSAATAPPYCVYNRVCRYGLMVMYMPCLPLSAAVCARPASSRLSAATLH